MAYSSWSVVFGEQPSAAKWNILGTNDAHFYSFLGDNTAWQTYSPTWTNLTTGNGTLNFAKYTQIGKTTHFRLSFTFGSTSSISGEVSVTLPATAYSGVTASDQLNGIGQFNDASGERYTAFLYFGSSTTVTLRYMNASATSLFIRAISSTLPMTWTTSDQILIAGSYEAA